ncbi:MAG: PIN domain-containing protein [Armatimonadetes bacterium]|nr:PIN domain-containing protein [Armatimonadota bacterium]
MTRTGCDTSFVVRIGTGHSQVDQVMEEARRGLRMLVIPAVVITEFLRLHYRLGTGSYADGFVLALQNQPYVQVVEINSAVAIRAAKLSHSLGLPTVDALVLAACLEAGCDEFWTTDKQHFAVAEQQGIVKVVWL